jgi:hypothetical protein
MNKTRIAAEKPRTSVFGGVLEGIFGIYLGWGVGAGLGVSIALIGSGAEVLGMPGWAWWFPVIGAAAMAWFYFLASKAGQAKEVRPFVRNCVALFGVLAALCFLLGAKEHGAFQDGGGPAGLNLDEMMNHVRQILAWGTLVVGPTIAFIGAGLVVLGLRQSASVASR